MAHLPQTLPGGLPEGWQSRVLSLYTDAAAMVWPVRPLLVDCVPEQPAPSDSRARKPLFATARTGLQRIHRRFEAQAARMMRCLPHGAALSALVLCTCGSRLSVERLCSAVPACNAAGIAQLGVYPRHWCCTSPPQPSGRDGPRWPGAPKCLPSLLEPKVLQQGPQGRQPLAARAPALLRRRRTSGVRRMLLTRAGQVGTW